MRFSSLMIIVGWAVTLLLPTGTLASEPQQLFWSSLTPFEIRTLQNIEKARSGDADTLLALALMASGDIRDQQRYDRIKRRIIKFQKSVQSDIGGEATIYAKGEKLLHAMHTAFFAGGDSRRDTELVEGYDSDQSQVSAIFRNGRFNCISSAILYIILARYLDLQVEGVATAHHAFIQIRGENGRVIEVETTSKQGYGLTHDAKFYRNHFIRFSISRNLAVPTYEDYLKRRVLPPYRFIAENMNHQHTAKKRMKPSDRHRLFEMMGYLDAETVTSQLIRLTALSNTCVRLLGQASTTDAERMMAALSPVLRHVKSRAWIRQTRQPDIAKIWERISALHLIQGHLLMKADRYIAARDQYASALKWANGERLQKQARAGQLKSQGYGAFRNHHWEAAVQAYQLLLPLLGASDHKQAASIRENIAAAYWNWAKREGDNGNWLKAARHYGAVADWTRNRNMAARARSAQTRSGAMHHLKRKEWDQAIAKFNAVLPHQKGGNKNIVRSNIGTAYIQWGNHHFQQQAYGDALDKYEAALGVLRGDDRDLVLRNIAAAYHNLTIPHLNAKRIDKAVAILNSGVRRFPDCAACREELKDLNHKRKAGVPQ